MKQGDVYRWSWKPDAPEAAKFEPYWCKAQMATVDERGRLVDIYWHLLGGKRDAGGEVLPVERVDLTLIANLGDLDPSGPFAHECYEPADVIDLRHKNGGAVYVRKGAKQSVRVQVETWTRKRGAALAEAASYQRLIDEAQGVPT